jgi:DNA invertase Pin-like site-specific DNA recombinase
MSVMGEKSGRWLRVSTKRQDEQSQVPDIIRWEESRGYDVKRTYTIGGASAYKGNKKFDATWAQVIKDFENGVITVLVVWMQNRLDRKLQTMRMIEEVREAGGRIEFVTQPHLNDLSSMGNRIALNVEMEIAHGDSENKSKAVLRTRGEIKANGGITSRAPFGYAIKGAKKHKYFVVIELLRPIIEAIFEKCISGDSLVTIAKWLDVQEIKTARGGKWSNTTVKNIINNRAYMGYIQDNEGKAIGTCPAIIDAAIWKSANDALKKVKARGPILAENRALCAGVLFCAACAIDSPMYRISAHDGPLLADGSRAKGYWYRCAGRGAQRKGCGNMIRLELVDAIVDEMMSNDDRPIMKRIFVPGHNHAAEIADVDFRISQLSPEGLTRAQYQEKLNALWDEKEAYEGMEDVPDDWTTEPVRDGSGNVVTYAVKWAAADLAGKQAMLKEMKITCRWGQIDGQRHPIVTIVPLWAVLDSDASQTP